MALMLSVLLVVAICGCGDRRLDDVKNTSKPPKAGDTFYYDGKNPDKMYNFAYLGQNGQQWLFASPLSSIANPPRPEEIPPNSPFIQFVVFPSEKNMRRYYAPLKRGTLIPETRYKVEAVKQFGPGCMVTIREIE